MITLHMYMSIKELSVQNFDSPCVQSIFALSRAQLLLLVVTRSRDLSRECHVTKHKTPARSNFPLSNFESSGTIPFSSSSSTSRGLCPKKFEKRGHPTMKIFGKMLLWFNILFIIDVVVHHEFIMQTKQLM